MRTLIFILCTVCMGVGVGYAQEGIDCSNIDFSILEQKTIDISANDSDQVLQESGTKRFLKRFNKNLIDDKLKYIGELTRSSDVLNVDDKEDDSGDIKDQKSTQTLFSIGYNYQITPVDIINTFHNLAPHQKKNFFLLGFFRLQNLDLIAKGAYSNTLLNELGEGVGESVKTEEKFTYAFGIKYTGCFGSLLRGKIGCIKSYSSSPPEISENTEKITINRHEIIKLHCMVKNLQGQVQAMQ